MLAGWAMLAETCAHEDCSMPLMRDPNTGEHICVRCSREEQAVPETEEFVRHAEADAFSLEDASAPVPAPETSATRMANDIPAEVAPEGPDGGTAYVLEGLSFKMRQVRYAVDFNSQRIVR